MMKRREDGILSGTLCGADCTVRPFNPQDCSPFKWECITGRGDDLPQIRVHGGARTEEEALRRAEWYAAVISRLPPCPV